MNFTIFIKNFLFRFLKSDISLNAVRCFVSEVSLNEGYGGKPILEFPPYTFMAIYQKGLQEEAKQKYQAWYYDLIINKGYFNYPKKRGGFQNGKLFNKIVRLHELEEITINDQLGNLDENLVRKAIDQLVNERFELFDIIEENGYDTEIADTILVTKNRGKYYLEGGGHHRACILKVLGCDSIPECIVMPGFIYKTLSFVYSKLS